jgi:hypothetical protein
MNGFIIKTGQSLATIAKIILLSKWKGILENSKLSKKQNCVIIGNGPSFKDTFKNHSEYLKLNTTLCVNSFATSQYYVEIKPEFYILNAPILFYSDQKTSPIYLDLRKSIFTAIKEKTNWKLNLMVPFIAKKSVEFHKLLEENTNIQPLYYNTTPAEGFSFFKHFLFRKGLGMPRPHNVIIPAIMNLIKLGFKEIYITGADHSWLSEISVNDINEALVNQKHFYDENESKPLKMEDYISRPRRLHEIIYKFYLSFKGYWEIHYFAQKEGVEIYNASEFSMIDAFERRKLN